MRGGAFGALVAGLVVLLHPAAAAAAEDSVPAFDLGAEITVDAAVVAHGGADRRVRALTNINVTADMDLAALIGWSGAHAHVDVLDNRGARPNDAAGSLQGVNNIEVARAGLRLFEAWVEQDLPGGASLRMGLYDVNSEFYANDSAALLIAPPFGIGSELAATGPNGPSIFPSSALAARLHAPLGASGGYVRIAAINARASTLGDSGGPDFSFRDGLLLIGETGIARGGWRIAAGAWRYTRDPVVPFMAAPDGLPLRRPSYGAYAVIERGLLAQDSPRQVTAFLRAGLSHPHSTPYAGGFQTGVLVAPALVGRAESRLSLGLNHAWTNRDFRNQARAAGTAPTDGESSVELTYADTLGSGLTIQPDVQWVRHPGAVAGAGNLLVATLRLTLAL